MKYAIPFLILIATACATNVYTNPNLKLIPDDDYYSLVEKETQSSKIYDGLMNVLDLSATILSTDVTTAQIDHNARVFQYDEIKYQEEKGKALNDLNTKTEIFLSIYVPERKYNDLARKTTTWKIFLDVGTRRYEAKVERIKGLLAEIQSLYPYHTRWSTAYKLTFPVPTSIVEKTEAKLTLTGPLTVSLLDFK